MLILIHEVINVQTHIAKGNCNDLFIHNLAPVLTWMGIVRAKLWAPSHHIATLQKHIERWAILQFLRLLFKDRLRIKPQCLSSIWHWYSASWLQGTQKTQPESVSLLGPAKCIVVWFILFGFGTSGIEFPWYGEVGVFQLTGHLPLASSLFDSLLKWSHAHRYKQTKIV